MQKPTRWAFGDGYGGVLRKRLGGLCGHNNAFGNFNIPDATHRGVAGRAEPTSTLMMA